VNPVPQISIPLLMRAAAFAAEHHRNQQRKGAGKAPYINHPLQVADLLAEAAGVVDIEVLCAALLHDTVEDTAVEPEDIVREFGPRIAALVAEVTDDKSLPKAERKALQISHAPHLSREAGLLKIADKTCNVRDMTRDPPVGWDQARVVQYLDWAEQVVGGISCDCSDLLQAFSAAIAEGRSSLQGGETE